MAWVHGDRVGLVSEFPGRLKRQCLVLLVEDTDDARLRADVKAVQSPIRGQQVQAIARVGPCR